MQSLSLGQFHFLLKHGSRNTYTLEKFIRFFSERFTQGTIGNPELFQKRLQIVVKRYRNSIAHGASMNAEECNHLRKVIFSGSDSLLKMCCSIYMNAKQ